MARRTYDDGLEDLVDQSSKSNDSNKYSHEPEMITQRINEVPEATSKSWEEQKLRESIELSRQVQAISNQVNEQIKEFEKNLQALKKMAESVNALNIKVYPVLEDGTKKKVREQVQEAVGDVIKDIENSVNALKEAKKENKGQWISDSQIWYWGFLMFTLIALCMTLIGLFLAPWLAQQPSLIITIIICAMCSNFIWYGGRYLYRVLYRKISEYFKN